MRCEKRNQITAAELENLQAEIAASDRFLAAQEKADDPSSSIPVHANIFDVLSEDGEEVTGEEEIDVTGYTGRSQGGEPEDQGKLNSTVWEQGSRETDEDTDPLTQV